MASLKMYREKRDFDRTPEPRGGVRTGKGKARFTVQKHRASRLHYDLRLELGGTLKSWAVPKGPSLDPSVKRLAMKVEDHPLDYIDFEGVIPEGNYGAGRVIVWDQGTYHHPSAEKGKESQKLLLEGLAKGDLKFILAGKKLKGEFVLIRTRAEEGNAWLLIKKRDKFATSGDILEKDRSVISRRKIEEVSAETDPSWESNKPVKSKRRLSVKPKKTVGVEDLLSRQELIQAPAAAMPRGITPMLATLIQEPFDDPGWLFEVKWDGYRAIAEVENGMASLYSRNRTPFTRKFHAIAESLKIFGHTAILDGEIAVLDREGKTHFQLLQNYERSGEGELVYYVFDLLYLDGRDLRGLPLERRKEILKEVLPQTDRIRFSDHVKGKGVSFFRLVQGRGIEGIMGKQAASVYQAGKRTRQWVKIKTKLRQEAVIGGFTEPRGSRRHFGSLVLGVYEDGDLVYVGHSGGGFDARGLEEMKDRLEPLIQEKCPFRRKPTTNMPARWVEPVTVAEVAFTEWTKDGLMRHPIFLGVREDVDPRKVVRERPLETATPQEEGLREKGEKLTEEKKDRALSLGGRKLKLTHLDKVFWPIEGYTKGDLVDYYRSVSGYLLPYLKDRPENLYRTPDGVGGEGFYQKNVGALTPDWVPLEEVRSETNRKRIKYLICNDESTLIFMVNLGCIEINPWSSRVQSLDSPDYVVVDLDPLDVSFNKVVEAALVVKEILDLAGARSFVKTSGATGMHIYIPFNAKHQFEIARDFAQLVGQIAHDRAPDLTSLERSPAKRRRKVYLDFLQNRIGQTLAAPYSVRPRPGAPVSTPLTWKEVSPGLDPLEFNMKTVRKRIETRGDPFKGVLGPGIDLAGCLKKLESKA